MARNYAVETISSLPFGMLIGGPLNAAIEAQSQAAKSTIDFILQVGFLPPNAANLQDPDPVEISQPDAAPAPGANPTTNAGQTRMVTFSYSTTNEDAAVVAAVPAAAAAAAQAANAAAAVAAVQALPNVPPAIVTTATDVQNQGGNQAAIAAAITAMTTQTATITVPILSVVPIPFFSIEEMTIDFMAKITEAITSNSRSQNQRVLTASTQAKGGWGPVSGSLKAGMSSTHSSTSERSSKYQTELTMAIHVRATSESMPKGMARVLDMLAGIIKSERA